MGVCERLSWAWLVVAVASVGASTVPKRGVNEIEEYVKRLEYAAREGNGATYTVAGLDGSEKGVQVDLNLLPDDVIVRDIEEGLEEEFALVDEAQGEKEERRNTTAEALESRQRSLIYRGVYFPDSRFNAFADGVMVNMVAEMKRKAMDPLYFRVYSKGIIEHVPVPGSSSTTSPSSSSTFASASASSSSSATSRRRGRQARNTIGGGVIRGLTNVKRFGSAEVQVAGNVTLVRSHYVLGPLNLDIIFNTTMGVRAVNSTLEALAAHTVAYLNETTSTDLIIDSPAPYEIQLVGAKSERYRRLSLSAMSRLFKPTGRLERRLKGAYRRARRRRIPDVTRRRSGGRRRGSRRNGNRSNGGNEGTVTETAPVTPELP